MFICFVFFDIAVWFSFVFYLHSFLDINFLRSSGAAWLFFRPFARHGHFWSWNGVSESFSSRKSFCDHARGTSDAAPVPRATHHRLLRPYRAAVRHSGRRRAALVCVGGENSVAATPTIGLTTEAETESSRLRGLRHCLSGNDLTQVPEGEDGNRHRRAPGRSGRWSYTKACCSREALAVIKRGLLAVQYDLDNNAALLITSRER